MEAAERQSHSGKMEASSERGTQKREEKELLMHIMSAGLSMTN
jgi:hypothetical protein